MQDRSTIGRLTGLLLAGVVVAIFAIGLAHGQDDWHAVLVLLGALLQVLAIVYATRRIWLGPLLNVRSGDQLERETIAPESAKTGQTQKFFITQEDALVAGGMAIAGVLLTLAGNLIA
jgi:hypothetical protein